MQKLILIALAALVGGCSYVDPYTGQVTTVAPVPVPAIDYGYNYDYGYSPGYYSGYYGGILNGGYWGHYGTYPRNYGYYNNGYVGYRGHHNNVGHRNYGYHNGYRGGAAYHGTRGTVVRGPRGNVGAFRH